MKTALLGAMVLLAAAQAAEPTLEQLREAAQQRMREDRARYSAEQFQEIEALYQSANRDLRADGAMDALKKLVDKYPQSNRAGCALLYVARLAPGVDREALLKQAIANHSDARYGDGTQVGAFARAFLADLLRRGNRLDEAKALAAEVVAKYPGAVDHSGRRIADVLKQIGLI